MRRFLSVGILVIGMIAGCKQIKQRNVPHLLATINAASCSSADVTTAIGTAAAGDTVQLPPCVGTTWGSGGSGAVVTLNKAITINGSGVGSTNITINGHGAWSITKQATGNIRIQNFTLKNINPEDSGGPTHDAVVIGGTWPTGDPIVIQNMFFDNSGATQTMFGITIAGGVIFSHDTYTGGHSGGILAQIKDVTNTSSWTGPTGSTLGNLDSTGKLNHYFEDLTFQLSLDGVDCDDNCRIVWRYNTMGNATGTPSTSYYSGGFNTHGPDSSTWGIRQFEIYNNNFSFQTLSSGCSAGNAAWSNINWEIWIRGGSGVIYNNTMDPLDSGCWGSGPNAKPMIKMDIRGVEDQRQGNPCGVQTYPWHRQLGQSNNGTTDITDPIYIWGNTSNIPGTLPNGVHINVANGWDWNNPCAWPDWNYWFQWGRDAVNTALTLPVLQPNGGVVEGQGGTAKGGYTAYTYPHPLTVSSAPNLGFSSGDFGLVVVGASGNLTITVTNNGTADQISGTPYFTLGGTNVGDFSNLGTGTCANGGTITQGGGSCTINMQFTPGSTGVRTATLTMNGTQSPAPVLNLSGQGQPAASGKGRGGFVISKGKS